MIFLRTLVDGSFSRGLSTFTILFAILPPRNCGSNFQCLEYASWLSCPLSLVFCTSWKGECCIAMNLTLLWKTFETTKTLKLFNTQHRDYSWSHYIPQSATRCSEPMATPCSNCPLYEEPSGRVKTPRPCLLKHQTSTMFNIFSTSSVHALPEMAYHFQQTVFHPSVQLSKTHPSQFGKIFISLTAPTHSPA